LTTNYPRCWINLTSVLTMKGDDERALAAARRGVELDGDSPLAHNNLAVALYFSERFCEAHRHMEKARQLGYSVDPNFVASLRAETRPNYSF
jgi:Flp pilus assembly protein TadD